MVRAAISALCLTLWPLAAGAECRLALLLALDVSASVDETEYTLQRDGLAAALNRPLIRRAILEGAPGEVAIAVYEWSGRYHQTIVLDWTMLDSQGAIDGAVATIARTQRSYSNWPTALGYSLGFGAGMLSRGPECLRQVIDVSGDGINNEGFGPELAYANFPFDEVTVNGLVVEGRDAALVDYYLNEVMRGPASFVEIALGFDDFEDSMVRKLFREINGLSVGWLQEDGWFPG